MGIDYTQLRIFATTHNRFEKKKNEISSYTNTPNFIKKQIQIKSRSLKSQNLKSKKVLPKQIQHRLSFPIWCRIKWSAFYVIICLRMHAQGMINRLMYLIDYNSVLYRRARSFIRMINSQIKLLIYFKFELYLTYLLINMENT